VYLGESFADVNAGAGDTFRGNQTSTMFMIGFFGFPYPDGLVPGTTYYWRIDEVKDLHPDSPWRGDVWSFTVPSRIAYDPDPPAGARYIDPDVTLGWTAGFGAKLHYVHFGDNFDDVNSAPGGQLVTSTSYAPGTLELEKLYYWRVDESDGITTFEGDVWSFTTMPVIPISDPNLVAWWKLDEGTGTNVVDWSGHGRHGSFRGDPQWVDGYDGSALYLDGNGDYVDFGNPPDLPSGLSARSMCAWGRADSVAGGYGWIAAYGLNAASQAMFIGRLGSDLIGGGYGGDDLFDYGFWEVGVWHHICLTYNGTMARMYADGIEVVSEVKDWNVVLSRTHVGRQVNDAAEFWNGLVDDVRVYNRAITAAEIPDIMRGDASVAWNPSPDNNSTMDVDRAKQPLTWSPGDNATQHDVYFGTERTAVEDANVSDTTGVYRGRQTAASYSPPEPLEWGSGPYYWRVDEFNTDGAISTGRIWSFTVADYLIVDDFESYNDLPEDDPASNLVYLTWLDGYDNPATNGSTIGYPAGASMETGTVHGGLQSVPYAYDNSFKSSQATRTLTSLRDWTQEGVTKLSLWFYGDPANAPERMNVALNGAAPVYHADPGAATIGDWTQWPIDLSRFGVPLTNVTSITIGFGVPGSTAAGGTGDMLFDDILLIR
jgi:hypothetical protein